MAGHSAKADGRWPPSRRPPLPTAKFCRVPGTRQRFFCRRPIFAEHPALGKGKFLPTAKVCRVSSSRQRQICRRPIFAECRWVRLSAKIAFAECPTESTRQSFLHSANQPCPVVIWHKRVEIFSITDLNPVVFLNMKKHNSELQIGLNLCSIKPLRPRWGLILHK